MHSKTICAAGSNADQVFSSWKNKSYNLEETLEQLASGIGQAYREGERECIGLEDGTGMIVNFPRDKTKLEFPAEIVGVRITVIGDNGAVNAEGYEKVTSVVIPEGVTEIGKKAFYWFKELSSVKLPDTLKTIEAGILDGHGENLRVTCGEGSGMERYLQENYPDVKIAYPGK